MLKTLRDYTQNIKSHHGAKKGHNGHIRCLDDPDFCKIFLRLLSYPLNGREIKYLLLRFYYNNTTEEIAKFDGRKVIRSRINQEFEKAYKKIKLDFRNL